MCLQELSQEFSLPGSATQSNLDSQSPASTSDVGSDGKDMSAVLANFKYTNKGNGQKRDQLKYSHELVGSTFERSRCIKCESFTVKEITVQMVFCSCSQCLNGSL